MSDIICRYGKPEDLDAIYELCLPYCQESQYGALFGVCEKTSKDTFGMSLNHPEMHAFVTEHDGKLTGIAIIVQSTSFFRGFEADIEFFYVAPDARANGTSRLLLDACYDWAEEQPDLNALHCGCHSMMDDDGKNEKLYTNLFKKYGFEVTGVNLHYIPTHKKGAR